MVSAMFEEEQNALALAPLMVMPTILFGGLMSNNEAQFEWLSWIQYVSPIKYCSEAMIYNEFMYDKYDVLDNLTNFIDYKVGLPGCLGIMFGMIIVFRFFSLLFFRKLVSKA